MRLSSVEISSPRILSSLTSKRSIGWCPGVQSRRQVFDLGLSTYDVVSDTESHTHSGVPYTACISGHPLASAPVSRGQSSRQASAAGGSHRWPPVVFRVITQIPVDPVLDHNSPDGTLAPALDLVLSKEDENEDNNMRSGKRKMVPDPLLRPSDGSVDVRARACNHRQITTRRAQPRPPPNPSSMFRHLSPSQSHPLSRKGRACGNCPSGRAPRSDSRMPAPIRRLALLVRPM